MSRIFEDRVADPSPLRTDQAAPVGDALATIGRADPADAAAGQRRTRMQLYTRMMTDLEVLTDGKRMPTDAEIDDALTRAARALGLPAPSGDRRDAPFIAARHAHPDQVAGASSSDLPFDMPMSGAAPGLERQPPLDEDDETPITLIPPRPDAGGPPPYSATEELKPVEHDRRMATWLEQGLSAQDLDQVVAGITRSGNFEQIVAVRNAARTLADIDAMHSNTRNLADRLSAYLDGDQVDDNTDVSPTGVPESLMGLASRYPGGAMLQNADFAAGDGRGRISFDGNGRAAPGNGGVSFGRTIFDALTRRSPPKSDLDPIIDAQLNGTLARPVDKPPLTEMEKTQLTALTITELSYDEGATVNSVATHYGAFRRMSNRELKALGLQPARFNQPENGLNSSLWTNGRIFIFTVTGSNDSKITGEDWRTNRISEAQLVPKQYTEGIELARDIQNRLKQITGHKLFFTGHSLGGGITAAAGSLLKVTTITFDAAGPSPGLTSLYGIKRNVGNVLNISHRQDPLSRTHDPIPFTNSIIGRQMWVGKSGLPFNHQLPPIREGILSGER